MVFIPSILNPAITFGTCRGIIMIRRILSQYATRHVNVIHSEVTNASFNHYIFNSPSVILREDQRLVLSTFLIVAI